jgi:hypothetical protein
MAMRIDPSANSANDMTGHQVRLEYIPYTLRRMDGRLSRELRQWTTRAAIERD